MQLTPSQANPPPALPLVQAQPQNELPKAGSPVDPSAKWVKILFLVILIIAFVALSAGYFLWTKRLSQSTLKQTNPPSSTNQPSSSPSQAQTPQISGIIYGFSSGDNFLIYSSDNTGKTSQSTTIPAGKSLPFTPTLSPDKTKLLYGKQDNRQEIFIHDFTNQQITDSQYRLASGSAVIKDTAWNPNGKEIIFILSTKIPSAQTAIDPYSANFYNTIQLGLLDLTTGVARFIDLSSTPMASEITLPALNVLFFYASSKPTLYIFEDAHCAPGPCHQAMYSFDWQTSLIKKFQIPEMPDVAIRGIPGDVNPSTGEFLIGDHGLDIYSNDQESTGHLQLYNPVNNSFTTLIDKHGYGFDSQDARFIDEHTILYSQAQLPPSLPNGSSVQPLFNWFIMDLNTKATRQVSFAGSHSLRPFNNQIGIVFSDQYELSLVDLTTGKETNIYESPDAEFVLLNPAR